MKQLLFFSSLFFFLQNAFTQPNTKVGTHFPIHKIKTQLGFDSKMPVKEPLLLVFVNQFSKTQPFAEMLGAAFENYFTKGFALRPDKQLKVIVIERNPSLRELKSAFKFLTIKDSNEVIFSALEKDFTFQKDATVILLDEKQIIRYYSDNYGAQGEKLKTLEKTVKEILGIKPDFEKIEENISSLTIGDVAPDFDLGNGLKLSDYRNKKPMLVSFYPAAFSGIIPAKDKEIQPVMFQKQSFTEPSYHMPAMCSFQIKSFSEISETMSYFVSAEDFDKRLVDYVIKIDTLSSLLLTNKNKSIQEKRSQIGLISKDVKSNGSIVFPTLIKPLENKTVSLNDNTKVGVVMISSSEPILLQLWEQLLDTKNVIYTNDKNYHIAQQYHSYNQTLGYNRRTVFIINKEGKIAHIDWDYGDNVNDFNTVQQHLLRILK